MLHQVRAGALRGSILNRKDGLDLLLQVLHSSDYSLAAAAAHTSLEMPGGEVTSALASELATLPPDRQILVIQMLGGRADSRAFPALSAAAKEGPQPVRLAAIRALAGLQDPAATPLLVDLLGDANQEVARQAQESLASIPGISVDEAVLGLIESSQTNRRLAGIELAARRRMPAAMSPMFKVASSGDPATREIAIRKLAELAPPSELPAFFQLLAKAQDPKDLEASEQALSTMCAKTVGADNCTATIARRFPNAEPNERCALLRVLGTVGGTKALQVVRTAVGETNAAVHTTAIRVLGSWNSLEAAPDLLELAQNSADPTDKTLCLRSYLSLASHTDFPADQRLAMCRQAAPLVQKEEEKKQLLAASGNLSSMEALDLVKPYFEDTALKEEAATATVNICEKVLQGSNASRSASQLIEPLDTVAQLTSNSDLAERAKKLVEQARKKQTQK
jgi:HEAT repeat protein